MLLDMMNTANAVTEWVNSQSIGHCDRNPAAGESGGKDLRFPGLKQPPQNNQQAAPGSQRLLEKLDGARNGLPSVLSSRTSNKRESPLLESEKAGFETPTSSNDDEFSQRGGRKTKVIKLVLPKGSKLAQAAAAARIVSSSTRTGEQVQTSVSAGSRETPKTTTAVVAGGRLESMDESSFLLEFEARGQVVRTEPLDLLSYAPDYQDANSVVSSLSSPSDPPVLSSSCRAASKSIAKSSPKRRHQPLRRTPDLPSQSDSHVIRGSPVLDITPEIIDITSSCSSNTSQLSPTDDETQARFLRDGGLGLPRTASKSTTHDPSPRTRRVSTKHTFNPTPSLSARQIAASISHCPPSSQKMPNTPQKQDRQAAQPHRAISSKLAHFPTPTKSPLSKSQPRSKTEQAVALLQEAYGEELEIDVMLRAITCLKDEVDAGIFITLKPGKLRDIWLKCLIGPANRQVVD